VNRQDRFAQSWEASNRPSLSLSARFTTRLDSVSPYQGGAIESRIIRVNLSHPRYSRNPRLLKNSENGDFTSWDWRNQIKW
jgi:hypothetical protein